MAQDNKTLATAETGDYWAAARRGELTYQFCRTCETPQFPARSLCTHCQSADLETRISTGRGTIESHTTVHRAPNGEFRARAPYVIALVRLEEGFRIMTNIFGDTAADTRIGQPARITFEARADGGVLPQAEVST